MEHRIEHGLGSLERARDVMKNAYAEYERKLAEYQPRLNWTDDANAEIAFTVMKKTITVNAALTPDDMTLTGKFPMLFRPFQGKVISVVESEVRKWVERAKSEAND